jgi:hypothetical protein
MVARRRTFRHYGSLGNGFAGGNNDLHCYGHNCGLHGNRDLNGNRSSYAGHNGCSGHNMFGPVGYAHSLGSGKLHMVAFHRTFIDNWYQRYSKPCRNDNLYDHRNIGCRLHGNGNSYGNCQSAACGKRHFSDYLRRPVGNDNGFRRYKLHLVAGNRTFSYDRSVGYGQSDSDHHLYGNRNCQWLSRYGNFGGDG